VEKKFNILVVEDNEETFKKLKENLSNLDYKIWRAASGREALKFIKKVHFTAVITELRLPDINGVKLIRRIKKVDHKVSIIVLTVYSFADLRVEAMKNGAFTYLMKPLNIEEVRLVLKRAVENTFLLMQAGRAKYYQDVSILDGLTAIYNHRYFQEKLKWYVDYFKRHPQVLSLFIIDIDDFKKYNDTKGHLAGDKVLHNTAQLFVDSVRGSDTVFRYGGEEFAVILPQTEKQGAERVGQRLISKVREQLPITISIGLATFPFDGQTEKSLVDKADKALYRAKRLGKDRICVYNEKLDG